MHSAASGNYTACLYVNGAIDQVVTSPYYRMQGATTANRGLTFNAEFLYDTAGNGAFDTLDVRIALITAGTVTMVNSADGSYLWSN
jgi:hypothetical protein